MPVALTDSQRKKKAFVSGEWTISLALFHTYGVSKYLKEWQRTHSRYYEGLELNSYAGFWAFG